MWISTVSATIALAFAGPRASAQNGYEFQRAIEHRRDFERELDSYRSRPNSTLGRGSVIPESEIRAWLEGRKAVETAWRDEETARRQREDAAKRDLVAANRARSQAIARSIATWQGLGLTTYDAAGLAHGLTARPDGTFARSERYRSAAGQVEAAWRRYRAGFPAAGYDECAQSARALARGGMEGDYDLTPVALATAGRCFEELAAQFPAHRTRALSEAAFFYARAARDAALWSFASTPERQALLASWARSAEGAGAGREREQFAAAVVAGSPSELFSPYDRQAAAWLEEAREDRWLRITPYRAGGELTALDQRAVQQTRELDLALLGFYRQRGEDREAARAAVRSLDRRGWPVAPADRAVVDAFFVRHPETVKTLGARELQLLQDAGESLTAPAIFRRLVLDDAKLAPAAKAVRAERAAQAAGDAGLALEAAYLYKGPVWEDYADPDALLRVARWALEAPMLDVPDQRLARARMEALGCALLQECSAANLTTARRLAAVAPEGRYAEILLLCFGRGRTAEQEREGLARIAELERLQPNFTPWDGRLGAPTPRALRALVVLPTLKTLEEASAEIVALQGASDPWATAVAAHVLLDPRRPEEHWEVGTLCLGIALNAGIRLAAADAGALHYFGRCGYARNVAEALPHLTRGAEAGYSPAVYALGLHYYGSDGAAPNPAKAFALLSRVTGEGRADAQAKCAQLVLDGKLGAPDFAKAADHARIAAELGHGEGALLYSRLLARGLVPGQAAASGRVWREKARERGHVGAARDFYVEKVRGASPQTRKAAVEEFVAFLDGKTPAERFLAALALLDDEPGPERIGFKDEDAGRELIESIKRNYSPAREYFEKHPW